VDEAAPKHFSQKVGIRPVEDSAALFSVVRRCLNQELVNVVPNEHNTMEVVIIRLHLMLDFTGGIDQTAKYHYVAVR